VRGDGHALVTGAAGFFGLAIVRALARAGTPVIASDLVPPSDFRLRAGTPEELVEYVRRDLAGESLADVVERVAGVVHAAAITPAREDDGEVLDALLAVNLAPLVGLLGAARRSGACSRFLLVSSAGVFDQTQARTLSEDDADGGLSLYGATKLASEIVARRYASRAGLQFVAVRPTSLFGPGELERPSRPRVTALARLVHHALRGEAVRVANETARTDWVAVDDAAQAVAALWQAPTLTGRSYNLSSATPRPFAEVVDAVVQVTGLRVDAKAPVVVDPGGDRPATIENRRIRSDFGWRPARSLADGVGELVEYLRTEGVAPVPPA
jgi:UDP-glucose 4-epimerase